MQAIKSVRFEDVENMMEQMMQVPIFHKSVKRELLSESNNKNCLNPNLIMDIRHKTIGEALPVSVTKSVVFAEVTKLLMDEETEALYRKREQAMLDSELKKFENSLSNSRPRFRGPYTCSKRKMFPSIEDYNELWKAAPRKVKVKVKDVGKTQDSETEPCIRDLPCTGGIKVTIKDKATTESKERDQEIMRMSFHVLLNYAKDERRLRELKLKIQDNIASRRLRKYFNIWKSRVENSKVLPMKNKKKEDLDISEEKKIEIFVNAINEKQKKLNKVEKNVTKDSIPRVKSTSDIIDETKRSERESRKSSAARSIHIVDPPAYNRLNAQKKIIAEQKMKLEEQNRIIEELRLRQIEDETKKAGKETINVAKEAFAYCGQKTRRSLIQLMREEGCRDKTLLEPPRIPSPPRFLARMEARAEARRERVRKAEEDRKRKAEEQRIKEETAKREEEENRKRLQLEAQREAKRIREEQERKRIHEIERNKAANELADKFYRKYLLRRYVMEPFTLLVELKHNYIKTAMEHFDKSLKRKIMSAWQMEMENQRKIKIELAISVWRRNILWYAFRNWREAAKTESRKGQVATDFYEMRLQERCLKIWSTRTIEAKITSLEQEQLANSHVEARLKLKYFGNWRKYLKIADEIKESDERRDKWRELVQRIVPDFDPKQRGVIIDD